MSLTTRHLARSPGGRFSLTDCRGSGVPTVTLVSLSLILALTLYEFVDYRRVHMVASLALSLSSFCRFSGGHSPMGSRCLQEPSIVVDKSRGEKLLVHLNVTFPRVPCYRSSSYLFHSLSMKIRVSIRLVAFETVLSVDIMDISGEHQNGSSLSLFFVSLFRHPQNESQREGGPYSLSIELTAFPLLLSRFVSTVSVPARRPTLDLFHSSIADVNHDLLKTRINRQGEPIMAASKGKELTGDAERIARQKQEGYCQWRTLSLFLRLCRFGPRRVLNKGDLVTRVND